MPYRNLRKLKAWQKRNRARLNAWSREYHKSNKIRINKRRRRLEKLRLAAAKRLGKSVCSSSRCTRVAVAGFAACAKCRAKHRAWIKTDSAFDHRLRKTYGIGIVDYYRLLKKQKNRCHICRKWKRGTYGHRFVVDHNHKTGKARGLLCNSCNSLVGYCQEKIKILMSAARYLRKYK